MAAVAQHSKGSFNWPVRVYYEDTDAGGVVYHSNYLKFIERARTEWLRHLGFEHTYLRDTYHVMFVVHSMQIAFKKPAKFNDLLNIVSDITHIGHGSVEFLQKIQINQTSPLNQPNQQLLVQAQVKLACVDAITFKPVAVPKEISLKMQQ